MSTEQHGNNPWAAVFIVLIGAVLIVNLSKGIFDLLAVRQRVSEAEGQVQKLQEKNQALEKQYITHTAPAYMEQEIREKLGLSRPGEVVVILPEQTATPAAMAIASREETEDSNLPIWRKWLRVLGW